MEAPTALRKTKIIATIGPACDTVETLVEMIEAGMNVTRLNLSHGTYEEHKTRIARIREAAKIADMPLAIMVDTRGIEVRTGALSTDSIKIHRHDTFLLYMDERVGDINGVSVTYAKLIEEVEIGQPILLDDGAMELRITALVEGAIECEVLHGGRLKASKGVNLPMSNLSITATGPESREDICRELSFAAENDVDYIAASFVQSAFDIQSMYEMLNERGAHIPIIAKIENRAGVDNMQEIVEAAGGLMVARGDLGVELPFGDVPATQKKMIRTTVLNGKPVITATQMLASMETNPRPTRAEASDVVNAVLDGTSALMLSGETAMGKYPVKAIETMAHLALRAETKLSEYGYLQKTIPNVSNVVTEAVSQGAVTMARQLGAKAIISLTQTGFTSRLISKHRPESPIIAITSSKKAVRQLCMNWGVIPLLYNDNPASDIFIEDSIQRAKQLDCINAGDTVVVTTGSIQASGGTDMIRVITLD